MTAPLQMPKMPPPPKQAGAAKPNRPQRMTLASITKGRKTDEPIKVVIYGVDGVGKSTFAAGAPNPIFLGAEDGTSQLDVARFPAPECWEDILDAVRTLTEKEHDFKTLALDSLDWAEPLVWAHVCERGGKESIEDFGYGKGYVAALDQWRIFLAALEKLVTKRGMHIVLIAHSVLKNFKNPLGEDFERYQLKLHDKAAGLVREWADACLFANYELFAAKDERTKRVRGVTTGARLLYTTYSAAWDAKNRYSLPETLPLGWEDFFAAVRSGAVADPAVLLAEIRRKAAEINDEVKRAQVEETVARFAGNPSKLAEINNRINALLVKQAEEEEVSDGDR